MRGKLSIGLVALLATGVPIGMVAGTASASTSWNAYLRTCKPILVNQEGRDYNNVYYAVGSGNASRIIAAANTMLVNTAQSISLCINSPDASLNQAVTSYTFYAYTAMQKVKGAAHGVGTVASVVGAIRQMNSKDKTVLKILATDIFLHR